VVVPYDSVFADVHMSWVIAIFSIWLISDWRFDFATSYILRNTVSVKCFRDGMVAANDTKAFQILNWERVSCIGYNLNLAVRDALSIPEISKIVAKGRKVVAYFHRSPLATV
jgi:hypothetical protein